MPSSNTITSFYTFVADTKARAAEVNNNFNVFRGNIIPVHVSTQTSADQTYDLGSLDYRWKDFYTKTINLTGATTTGQLEILNDTATVSGAFDFQIGGSSYFKISTSGFSGNNATPMGQTTTAAIGQLCVTAVYSGSYTASVVGSTTSFWVGSTATVTTNGRPVFVGVMSGATATGGGDGVGSLLIESLSTTTGTYRLNAQIVFCRDTSTSIIAVYDMDFSDADQITWSNPACFHLIDAPAAGNYSYFWGIRFKIGSSYKISIKSLKTYAYEI